MSKSVTVTVFPALFTVNELITGFTAVPVYIYSDASRAICPSLISTGLMLNLADKDPVFELIPLTVTVATPSSMLSTYTSA